MSNNFVPVPAETLEAYLQSLGFQRTIQGQEVVYFRVSERNLNVRIKVYTSIRVGVSQVRAAGRDSIKVCVVFDDGSRSFGIGKFPPVFRVVSVESILNRLFEKVKIAARRAQQWMDQEDAKNPQARAEWEQRLADKAIQTSYETAREQEGFMSDPGMQDPSNEPPDSAQISFEQYVDYIEQEESFDRY